MILSQNLRKGTVFKNGNDVLVVMDYAHIKMARGGATIRVKHKNLLSGVISEDTFNSSEKFEEADLENKNYQYLYDDGDKLNFMDTETYEQVSFLKEPVKDQVVFLKDGDTYQLVLYEGKLVKIELAKTMTFEVEYTEPGHKGDTSGTTLKPAKLENGIEVKVPLFINIGDKVKINTDTLEYKERASK
jgi:elongation factor P